jgi:hypothetical protein
MRVLCEGGGKSEETSGKFYSGFLRLKDMTIQFDIHRLDTQSQALAFRDRRLPHVCAHSGTGVPTLLILTLVDQRSLSLSLITIGNKFIRTYYKKDKEPSH